MPPKRVLEPTPAIAEIANKIIETYLEYVLADTLVQGSATAAELRRAAVADKRRATKRILALASELSAERDRQRRERQRRRDEERAAAWRDRPALDPQSAEARALYAEWEAAGAKVARWTEAAANYRLNNPNKHRAAINKARRRVEAAERELRYHRLPPFDDRAPTPPAPRAT